MKIKRILGPSYAPDEYLVAEVGVDDVTRIVGQADWFEVWKDDFLSVTVNRAHIEQVFYFPEGEPQ